MNKAEKIIAKNTSRVLRVTRKQGSLTQRDVAKKLSISQSVLSKMEAGILLPSIATWFSYCEWLQLPVDSHLRGYLDFSRTVTLNSPHDTGSFRIPKKYGQIRGSTARTMQPFLKYFREKLGEEALEEHFVNKSLDSDYFYRLDNDISITFLLDTVRAMVSKGVLRPENLMELIAPVRTSDMHGLLSKSYDRETTGLGLLKNLFNQAALYEKNFEYLFKEDESHKLTLAISPMPHLKETTYRADDLGDFLCRYKQAYFQEFAHYNQASGQSSGVHFREKECHFRDRAPHCVYEFTAAAT